MEESDGQSNDIENYNATAKYWDRIPATVDGMLGGYGFISNIDIKGSASFLHKVFQLDHPPSKNYALDCGAGIGRITKGLLLKSFKHIDLVEQNPKFLETAKNYLKNHSSRINEFYLSGLQNFCPTPNKYDVIWCQWVLGYLQDTDLVEFLKKCMSGLRENGVLIVKENVTSSNKAEMDAEDSHVTRSINNFKQIFYEADLICVKEKQQKRFPQGLYPVYMFALKPAILSC